MLQMGTAAKNILALTYTRKAAEEMKDRLHSSLNDNPNGGGGGGGVARITVSTLHGFCVLILRRFMHMHGIDPFSIYDDDDSRRIVKALLQSKSDGDAERGGVKEEDGEEQFSVARVRDCISHLKRTAPLAASTHDAPARIPVTEKYSTYGDGAKEHTLGLVALSKALLPEYEAALESRNALDFDDLILKTFQLLRICREEKSSTVSLFSQLKLHFGGKVAYANPAAGSLSDDLLAHKIWAFGERIRDTYRHVLVDEWQDIDPTQYALIRELCYGVGGPISSSSISNSNRSLFVVGDADQTIYSWRGADPRMMDDFPENFPCCTSYNLTTNFRSHEKIVRCAHSVISNSRRRAGGDNPMPLLVTPAPLPGGVGTVISDAEGKENREKEEEDDSGSSHREWGVEVINSYNDASQARFVADTVRYLVDSGTFEAGDIAVLCRKHKQALPIEAAFVNSRIPYALRGGPSLMERKSAKDACAYLRLLLNPGDESAFRRVINYPRRGIGQKVQALLFDELGSDLFPTGAVAGAAPMIRWGYKGGGEQDQDCDNNRREYQSRSVLEMLVSFAKERQQSTRVDKGKTGGSRKCCIVHKKPLRVPEDGTDELWTTVEYQLTTRQAAALQEIGLLFDRVQRILADWDQNRHSVATTTAENESNLSTFVSWALQEVGLVSDDPEAEANAVEDGGKASQKTKEELKKQMAYRRELSEFVALVALHEARALKEMALSSASENEEDDGSLRGCLLAFLDGAVIDAPDQDDAYPLLLASANVESREEGALNDDPQKTDLKQQRDGDGKVQVMTIHASKGLEFGCVLLAGVEEGILPSVPGGGMFGGAKKKSKSRGGGKKGKDEEEGEEEDPAHVCQVEEERRLLYVGMTRAKRKLVLLYRSRLTLGLAGSGKKPINIPVEPSRFLRDLPADVEFKRSHF
jgi:superfamily I DNA/RNA helicase